VLCWFRIPLGPHPWLRRLRYRSLRLFVGFVATVAGSDFSRACIIGYLHEPAPCMGKTEGQPDCSSLTRALGQTCRPHSHRPAGCLHSRSIAPRSQPCRGRPRIRKPQRVVTVLPTIGHPPHEPRIGRPWCAPFRGRGPASASRRKRTMAPRGWFATGAHRAPSATTLSASPSWPGSSDRDGRHDRPGSAPAGTASRTRRTSRPTVI
jgi:hypothetical protein